MKKSEKIAFFSVKENGTLIDTLSAKTVIKFGVWENIDFVVMTTMKTGVKVKNPESGQIMTVPFGTKVKVIPNCYYHGIHF